MTPRRSAVPATYGEQRNVVPSRRSGAGELRDRCGGLFE
jgi:hypothetical protein